MEYRPLFNCKLPTLESAGQSSEEKEGEANGSVVKSNEATESKGESKSTPDEKESISKPATKV